ncbi:MAG: FKBP-type peptidyl-prolyl cis-trans isomerase [Bacteroidota bacterium]
MRFLLYCVLGAVLFLGCENQSVVDEGLIEDFLAENNITAEKTDDGLYYTIEREGTGSRPDFSSTVTVHYEGRLLENGDVFDSSYARNEKATFSLSRVILGWQLGIPKLREGGKGTLYIPSELGYGSQGSPPSIPGDAVLIFEVELFDVQ